MRIHVVLLAALTLAACAKAGPPAPPVSVQPSQVESMLVWSSDLDGKRVSVEGYVGFDNGPSGQGIALGPMLTTQPFGRGDEMLKFEAPRGTGANQLNLPVLERRSMANIPAAGEILIVDVGHATFQDQAGAAHPLSGRVVVTGTLTYPRIGNVGVMSDPDPRSPSGRRFRPRLVDVVLDAPSH